MGDTKTCKRCGETKPLGEFYTDGRRGGRKPDCKACYAAKRKGKHRPAENVGVKTPQECSQCGAAIRDTRKRRFCGRECYYQCKNRHVEKPCVTCGKLVIRPPKHKHALCSDVCAVKWHAERRAKSEARRRRKASLTRRRKEREQPFRRALARERRKLWTIALKRASTALAYRTKARQQYYADPWLTKFTTWAQWSKRRPRPNGKGSRQRAVSSEWEEAIILTMQRMDIRRAWFENGPWYRKFVNKLSNLRKRRRSKREASDRRSIDGHAAQPRVQVCIEWDSTAPGDGRD